MLFQRYLWVSFLMLEEHMQCLNILPVLPIQASFPSFKTRGWDQYGHLQVSSHSEHERNSPASSSEATDTRTTASSALEVLENEVLLQEPEVFVSLGSHLCYFNGDAWPRDQVSPQISMLHVLFMLCGTWMATGRCCAPDQGCRELKRDTSVCFTWRLCFWLSKTDSCGSFAAFWILGWVQGARYCCKVKCINNAIIKRLFQLIAA